MPLSERLLQLDLNSIRQSSLIVKLLKLHFSRKSIIFLRHLLPHIVPEGMLTVGRWKLYDYLREKHINDYSKR